MSFLSCLCAHPNSPKTCDVAVLLQHLQTPVTEKYVRKYTLDRFAVFKADRWFDRLCDRSWSREVQPDRSGLTSV